MHVKSRMCGNFNQEVSIKMDKLASIKAIES